MNVFNKQNKKLAEDKSNQKHNQDPKNQPKPDQEKKHAGANSDKEDKQNKLPDQESCE